MDTVLNVILPFAENPNRPVPQAFKLYANNAVSSLK